MNKKEYIFKNPVRIWVINMILNVLGLGTAIFVYLIDTRFTLYIDHSIGTMIGFVYPYMAQPIGTLCLFVANIHSKHEYQKKYLFNPLCLLIILFLQCVPCILFFLMAISYSLFSPLIPLARSPAYQIAIDVSLIAYTLAKYIALKKRTL